MKLLEQWENLLKNGMKLTEIAQLYRLIKELGTEDKRNI